jgi:hypothetical protein
MTEPFLTQDQVIVSPDTALWAGKMIPRTIDPVEPEFAEDYDPKKRAKAMAEYHKKVAVANFAKRAMADLDSLLERLSQKGNRAKFYSSQITAAMLYYEERRIELKAHQAQALSAVEEFERNFTGRYVLGTLSALLAKPLFLLLQILGLWAIFGTYVPWLTGKTGAPEGANPTIWIIVFQVAAGVFAAALAFLFRGILMSLRMKKLAKKKDRMTALANYRLYDGLLHLVIATALAANKAYAGLTGAERMPDSALHAFWDDVVDCDDGRREFASRAGVDITEIGEVATSLGMTGEEDTLFEALADMLTN